MRAIEFTQKTRSEWKKSLEKSKIILEEKRKNVKQQICTFTIIGCHSRTIKQPTKRRKNCSRTTNGSSDQLQPASVGEHQFRRTFHSTFSIKLPPIEFNCLKLWLRENFRSRETQKVKGVKVTRKVNTVKRKCCKKTHVYNNFFSTRAIKHNWPSVDVVLIACASCGIKMLSQMIKNTKMAETHDFTRGWQPWKHQNFGQSKLDQKVVSKPNADGYLQTTLWRLSTYPADSRKIAAVDSNKHDWDWNNRRYWKKKDFCAKTFF